MLIAGCDNAEYKVMGNSIYLADADGKSTASTITVENGADIVINVRLAQKAAADVSVALEFNPEDIDEYNEMNGTEYRCLAGLPQDVAVTVPAGSVSASYMLHVDDYAAEGITYAVPVRLGEVIQGDVRASSGQGKYVYVLAKPLIVSAPVMSGAGMEGTGVVAGGEWGFEVETWTFEAWIRMSGFSANNQGFFRSGTTNPGNIFMRFGDANGPFNYLQVKLFGGQVETAKDLVAGQWYHWAMVYDGTAFTIYRNGTKDVSFTPSAPASIVLEYVRFIDTGAAFFKDECTMSQVRFWKTARTETEIKANMYYEVSPQNPNLIAYWPMNEGQGSVFKDITGNGHDAVAADGVICRWEEGIRFDK